MDKNFYFTTNLCNVVFVGLVVILTTFDANASKLAQNDELDIARLLSFVRTSNCQFLRNGDLHSAKDAEKHIKKKYRHYKNDISSVEVFIELAATKSSLSGDVYKIQCPNKEENTSKEWLISEYRRMKKEPLE